MIKIFGERNTSTNALHLLIERNSVARLAPSVARDLDPTIARRLKWARRLRLPHALRERMIDRVFAGRDCSRGVETHDPALRRYRATGRMPRDSSASATRHHGCWRCSGALITFPGRSPPTSAPSSTCAGKPWDAKGCGAPRPPPWNSTISRWPHTPISRHGSPRSRRPSASSGTRISPWTRPRSSPLSAPFLEARAGTFRPPGTVHKGPVDDTPPITRIFYGARALARRHRRRLRGPHQRGDRLARGPVHSATPRSRPRPNGPVAAHHGADPRALSVDRAGRVGYFTAPKRPLSSTG